MQNSLTNPPDMASDSLIQCLETAVFREQTMEAAGNLIEVMQVSHSLDYRFLVAQAEYYSLIDHFDDVLAAFSKAVVPSGDVERTAWHASALTHTDDAGILSSFARMDAADGTCQRL